MQNEGRRIILLGGLGRPDFQQFGSSQFVKVITQTMWGIPPRLDMAYEKNVQTAIRELVRAGLVESSHDLGDGGLAVALAECCFGPAEMGAQVDLDSDLDPTLLLFHEGPSRVLVSTSQPEAVLAMARKNSVEAVDIGVTLKSRVLVRNRTETYLASSIEELKSVWSSGLTHLLHLPTTVVA